MNTDTKLGNRRRARSAALIAILASALAFAATVPAAAVDSVDLAVGREFARAFDSHLIPADDASGLQIALWTDERGLWLRQVLSPDAAAPLPPAVLLQRGRWLRHPRGAVVQGSTGDPALVVAWQEGDRDEAPESQRTDILVRAFTLAGVAVGAPTRLTRGLRGFQVDPEVAALAGGAGAVVAWSGFDGGFFRRLMLRALTGDAQPRAALVRGPLRLWGVKLHLMGLSPGGEGRAAGEPAFVVGSTVDSAPLFETFDTDGRALEVRSGPRDSYLLDLDSRGDVAASGGEAIALLAMRRGERDRVRADFADFEQGGTQVVGFIGPDADATEESRWYPIAAATDSEGRLAISYGYFHKYGGLLQVEVRFFDAHLEPRAGRRLRLASGALFRPSTPVLGDDGTASLLVNVRRGNRWVLVLLQARDPA